MTDTARELRALLTEIRSALLSRSAPHPMRTRVIAIDGAGRAGKSTFARHLAPVLDPCQIIHTDDFASWNNPVDWWPELVEQVLDPLSRGQPVQFVPSKWDADSQPEQIDVPPADFLILEGVTACRTAFRPYLAYGIWIETNDDLRLRRGLERDGEEARLQWEAWIAAEDLYRRREQPDEWADMVVSGERGLWK